MMGVAQARKLVRFREGQRRVAAADLAAATGRATDAETRVEQIIGLAGAVAAGRGVTGGSDLAARGEFVGRLHAGQIVATLQRDRQAGDADEARRRFGQADGRAGIAAHSLAETERLELAAAEQRAALKAPFRRMGT